MSTIVIWEADYILECFLWGIFLIVVYDIVRIIRIVIPHSTIIIAIEDVIYWIAASIGMFLVLYKGNDGTIRFFAIGTTVVAMCFFNACISRFTVPFLGNILAFPFRLISKLLHKIQLKIKNLCRKQLKKIQKEVKIKKEKREEERKKKTEECLESKGKKRCLHGKRAGAKQQTEKQKRRKQKKEKQKKV